MLSYRVLFVAIIAILLVLGAAFLIYHWISGSSIDDGYAIWGASELVIDYMKDHEGAWPRSWADLKPYFDESHGNVPGWSFEKYQQRVGIDFNANSDELRRISKQYPNARFSVIWARSPFAVTIGDDPNERLRRYFSEQDGGIER